MKRPFFAPKGRRPLERLARGALLLGVFALVVVAFQKHFESVIDTAQRSGTLSDPGHVLADADRAWVLEQARDLRDRHGLELRVVIGGPAPAPVAVGPKTAFLFADAACQASSVLLAPLAVAALPAGFPDDLGREHLDAACRQGRLREGILASLGLLTASLDQAAGRGKGATHD
ncbi:MAG: TPM domain-containing protein [Solidesulfovibrio sp. DCME]|uniref:TPM domain-containing protein n=1 Tax=Solidesulfovibrio sp. DCME TaxID=3447380 RepID=UPI003D097D56